MPDRAKRYAISISAAGAIALAAGLLSGLGVGYGSYDTLIRFLVFFIPAVITSIWKMRLPIIDGSYSWSFAFILLSATQLSLAETVAMGAVTGLLASVANRNSRPTSLQASFNTANVTLSAAVAWGVAHCFDATAANRPAILAAVGAAYFVTNTVIVSGVLALLQGKPLREVCRQWYQGPFLYFVIGVALVGLLPQPTWQAPAEAWLVLVPLLYLVHFFHGLTQTRAPEEESAPAAAGMPWKARAHLTMVILAGALIAGWSASLWDGVNLPRLAVYLAASALLSGCKLKLPRTDTALSLGFIITLVAIAQATLPEAILIGGVSALVQSYWKTLRRPMPVQVLFNFFSLVISVSAAYGVTRGLFAEALADSPAAFFATAAIALYVINTVVVAAMLAHLAGRSLGTVWQWNNFWLLPYYLAGAAGAAVITAVARDAGWEMSLLVLPLFGLLHIAYRLKLSQWMGTVHPAKG
ncbi:MAG: hypothetical protein R2762_01695 [Bryobacteraceae bacterium]